MQERGVNPGNSARTQRHPAIRTWRWFLVWMLAAPAGVGATDPAEPLLVSSPHPELLTRFGQRAANHGYQVTAVDDARAGWSSLELLAVDPEGALAILLGQDSYLLVYAAGSGALIRAELLGSANLDERMPARPDTEAVTSVAAEVPAALEAVPATDDVNADSRRFELQSVPPDEAVDKLAHALGSRRESDRAWAVTGLGEFGLRGDQRAVLVLGQVLFSESSAEIREDVVNWLKSIGDEKAAHFVNAAGNDPSEAVRKAAGVE